jgi:hypothetical protein
MKSYSRKQKKMMGKTILKARVHGEEFQDLGTAKI